MKKVMSVSIGFSAGKPGGIDRRGVDQVPVVPVLSGSKYRKFSGIEVSSCTPLQDRTSEASSCTPLPDRTSYFPTLFPIHTN